MRADWLLVAASRHAFLGMKPVCIVDI